jgi:hypothetical protein
VRRASETQVRCAGYTVLAIAGTPGIGAIALTARIGDCAAVDRLDAFGGTITMRSTPGGATIAGTIPAAAGEEAAV